MKNKKLKKYLSLSLGVINVLSPMAIATLTGNLMSSAVNASAGSESFEVVWLPSRAAILLDNSVNIFDLMELEGAFKQIDFDCGLIKFCWNNDKERMVLIFDPGNGKKYELWGYIFPFVDEDDRTHIIDLRMIKFAPGVDQLTPRDIIFATQK